MQALYPSDRTRFCRALRTDESSSTIEIIDTANQNILQRRDRLRKHNMVQVAPRDSTIGLYVGLYPYDRRMHAERLRHSRQIGQRPSLPSFSMTWPRWIFHVISLRPISAAICLFISPAVTKAMTSRSREVNVSYRARMSTAPPLLRHQRRAHSGGIGAEIGAISSRSAQSR